MIFDLEEIQKMWEKDTHIDMDNLHDESIKVPALHAKYFEMYNTVVLLKKKRSKHAKTSDTNDTNILLVNLIQKFTKKIHSLKKLEIKILSKNISILMINCHR